MFDNEKRYQNLLEQIHELKRQNFLNNSDKIEELINKFSNFEEKILSLSISNKNDEKKNLILYTITGLNLFITIISFIIILFIPNNRSIDIKEDIKEVNIETNIKKNDSILVLKKEEILVNEEFEEIKPIIRKDTSYYCVNEDKTYKIPYTVEIKGKLYKDRFTFILKDDSTEKDCFIKKENL